MPGLEAASKHLLMAVVGAASIIIFFPALVPYYPYDVRTKTTYVTISNPLFGGTPNNNSLVLAPMSFRVLPSDKGDSLQPSGKRNYKLVGDVFSNASVIFMILDNSSFNEFTRNSSAAVLSFLSREISSGQTVNVSLSLTNDGLYYYVFLSRESSVNALLRFDLNETWSYEVVVPDVRFSILRCIVPPVAVFGGAVLMAISLVKLRRIASAITPKGTASGAA